jgi:hypothetical protein
LSFGSTLLSSLSSTTSVEPERSLAFGSSGDSAFLKTAILSADGASSFAASSTVLMPSSQASFAFASSSGEISPSLAATRVCLSSSSQIRPLLPISLNLAAAIFTSCL